MSKLDKSLFPDRRFLVVSRSDEQVEAEPERELLRRIRLWIVILLGVLPILVGILYHALATPLFASHAAITVKSSNSAPDRFSFMNYGQSIGNDGNNDVVVAYIESRQLIRDINHDGYLNQVFGARDLDIFARFPSAFSGRAQEDLYRHAQSYIDVEYDRTANIIRLSVRSFNPQDARELTQRILARSEAMLNRLNQRSYENITGYASRSVEGASANLSVLTDQLTAQRKAQGVLDPKLNAPAAIQLASETQAQMALARIDLEQARRTAPANPVVANLRARQSAIASELGVQQGQQVGGTRSLADRFSRIDELNIRQEVAGKQLYMAAVGLEAAKGMADQRRLYIEHIDSPGLPDRPLYERTMFHLLITVMVAAGVSIIAWALAGLLIDVD